jgi:DNA transposition AAA+ family ATPase
MQQLSDQDLINALQIYRGENLLSLREIADQLGYSDATLSTTLAGKYTGDQAGVLKKIREWLMPKIRPEQIDVVRTETFEALINYFEDAFATHAIYSITGKSGFGKTVAGKYFALTHLRAYLVRGRVAMGPKALLEEIIKITRIRTAKGRTVYHMQNEIIDWFKARSALLIVDEADKLSIPALDSLREIYDEVPTGLVLIGEPSLESKLLTPDRNNLSLIRLYSRIDEFISIDQITREDVAMFLKGYGINSISSQKAFDYLVQNVNKRGGYRRLAKLARRLQASIAVGESDGKVTYDQLTDILSRFPN